MGETSGKDSDIAKLHEKLEQSCNAAMKRSIWYIVWDVKEVTHHIKLAQDKIHIETIDKYKYYIKNIVLL